MTQSDGYMPHLRPSRHRPRSRAWRRWPIVGASTLAALLLLAIPVAVAVDSWPGPVADRHETDAPPASRALLAAYDQHAQRDPQPGAPTILSYHDIRPEPSSEDIYTVAPESFAAQMAMLDRAGFTVLDPNTFVSWLRGETEVPAKSVVLTFDDGTKGLWSHADPVLERHGFSAIVFVITAYVGEHQPYYLNGEELERMVESGRWSAQAHTHEGHVRIPVDEYGGTAPSLLNRELRDGQRETFAEWEQRVTADMAVNRRALVDRGFAAPIFFAYPFSSVIAPTNDPQIPDRLSEIVNDSFEFAVVNDASAGPVRERDVALAHIPRLEILRDTSAEQLFDRLSVDETIEPGSVEPFSEPDRWFQLDYDRVPRSWFGPNGLSPEVPAEEISWSSFAPGQSAEWQDYRAAVTVSDLGDKELSSSGALQVLSGSDAAYRISTSPSQLRIARGRTGAVLLERLSIPIAAVHRIEVEVSGFEIVVSVDGVERWRGEIPRSDLGEPTGGIALASWRNAEDAPQPTFSELEVEPLDGDGP